VSTVYHYMLQNDNTVTWMAVVLIDLTTSSLKIATRKKLQTA